MEVASVLSSTASLVPQNHHLGRIGPCMIPATSPLPSLQGLRHLLLPLFLSPLDLSVSVLLITLLLFRFFSVGLGLLGKRPSVNLFSQSLADDDASFLSTALSRLGIHLCVRLR